MKFLTALILLGLIFASGASSAFAQSVTPVIDASSLARTDGSLTVSPAYIEVTLTEPGEERTIPLKFTNNSSRPVTIEMFPIDFNYSDANGTIGFLSQSAGTYSYSLASYLSLEANQLQIEPKQTATFDVLVRNRPDLTPGGHYGAVIAKIISGIEGQDGAQVSPSLSSLIFLRKTGGERYNLSLKQTGEEGSLSFSYPTQIFLEFQNEGNIHLVPYGTVEIKDVFGRVLREGVLNTSSFLVMPESRRNMIVDLRTVSRSLPISINTLTVRGNDSLKKTTFLYRNVSFYIAPWFLLLLLLIIIIVIVLRKRKKSRNTDSAQKVEETPPRQPKRNRKVRA